MNSKTAKQVYEQIVSTKILDSAIRKNHSVKKSLLSAIKNIEAPLSYPQPDDKELINEVVAITYIGHICSSVINNLDYPRVVFNKSHISSESISDIKDILECIDYDSLFDSLKRTYFVKNIPTSKIA